MKKLLLASLTIFGLAIMPACSSDDDDNGNGNGTSSHPVVGTWNIDEQEFSGSGDLDLGLAVIPYVVNQKKIGGAGTLQFNENPNTIVGNGIIEVETEFEVTIFGQTTVDSYTENEDLSESFANATYQILEGNKIRITVDGESQTLDYDITGNVLTLSGKSVIREENPAGGADLELDVDVMIKLSK